jgi:hypothetical protein
MVLPEGVDDCLAGFKVGSPVILLDISCVVVFLLSLFGLEWDLASAFYCSSRPLVTSPSNDLRET